MTRVVTGLCVRRALLRGRRTLGKIDSDRLTKRQMRGSRAVSAEGLQGKGLQRRVFFHAPTASKLPRPGILEFCGFSHGQVCICIYIYIYIYLSIYLSISLSLYIYIYIYIYVVVLCARRALTGPPPVPVLASRLDASREDPGSISLIPVSL